MPEEVEKPEEVLEEKAPEEEAVPPTPEEEAKPPVKPAYGKIAAAIIAIIIIIAAIGIAWWYVSQEEEVPPVNQPPKAAMTVSPTTVNVGENITCDAATSLDPDGTIVDYAFDFGDNSNTSGTGAVVTHSYTVPGIYKVWLMVTDNNDASDNLTSANITVIHPEPLKGSLDGGLFTAETEGGGEVKVTSGTKYATTKISVTTTGVVSVTITPSSATINSTGYVNFSAEAKNETGGRIAGATFTWEVENGSIGSIDIWGNFTPSGDAGTTKIYAWNGTIKGEATVTVNPGPIDYVRVRVPSSGAVDYWSVPNGASTTFVAKGFDANGNELSGLTFTWSVYNDTGKGTFNSTTGKFTGKQEGKVFLNATSGGKWKNVTITVAKPESLYKIVITPADPILNIGGYVNFTAVGNNYTGGVISVNVTWGVMDVTGSANITWENNTMLNITATNNAGIVAVGAANVSTGIYVVVPVTIQPNALDHIEIEPTDAKVVVGHQIQFTATGYDQYNNIVDVTFEWSVNITALGTFDQPPYAAIIEPRDTTITAGEYVIFNGSESWAWTWDGEKFTKDPTAITNWTWAIGTTTIGYGVELNHTFAAIGNYGVKLTVTKATGLTDSVMVTIRVE